MWASVIALLIVGLLMLILLAASTNEKPASQRYLDRKETNQNYEKEKTE